jgi:hypothetical protein
VERGGSWVFRRGIETIPSSRATDAAAPQPAPAKPGGSTMIPSPGIGIPRAPSGAAPTPLAPSLVPVPGLAAPGATPFLDREGLGWILLDTGCFECIQAPYGRQAELHVQVARDRDPTRFASLWAAWQAARGSLGDVVMAELPVPAVPRVHVVQKGESAAGIARQYGITLPALLAANQDKVKWADKGDRKVPFFLPGVSLVIPPPPGTAPAEETWSEWAERIAREFGDVIVGIGDDLEDIGERIGDGLEWLGDQIWGDEDPEKPGDDRPAGDRLPDATVTTWVDRAAALSKAKFAADKNKVPYEVEQIDAWLPELAKDQAATSDPVQRRVLAGVQFQFETTKRGTTYFYGSARDYDVEGQFDCSEGVQWMLMQAGMEDIFGEAGEKSATLYMTELIHSVFGDQFRAAPQVGDIMMWPGHVAMVMDVRPSEGIFYASHMGTSGSRFNALDLNDPVGAAKPWGKGPLLGFWSPESASLPAAIGTATVNAKRKAIKYTVPERGDLHSLDSLYAPGEELEVLKTTGDSHLVHRAGTRGAAWVWASALDLDAPAPAP